MKGQLFKCWCAGTQWEALPRGRRFLWRYGLALACTLGAWLLRLALQPILHDHQPFPTFFLAVILVNWWCGLGPSLFTIALGALLADLGVRHYWWPATLAQWIGLATYLLVSLVIVWCGWLNRKARDACAREVQQHQQAEAAARQSEARLAMMAAATFEGVAISENCHFIELNEQFAAMLGYPRQELLGRPLGQVIAPEDHQVLDLIAAGVEVRAETTMLRKDGSRFIGEAHGKTAQFGDRRLRFTAIRDITQRKQAEDALREAKEALTAYNVRLERAVHERTAHLHDTIAELHHFSYALAHNLRAPLRATSGYLTLIARHTQDSLSPANREWFRRAQLATEHLDQLITDALDYSKAVLRELPLEPVDLDALLAALLQTQPHLQAHEQHIHIVSVLPRVLGNRTALLQCFSNLLDNALKFTRPGIPPRVEIGFEQGAGSLAGSAGLVGPPPQPLPWTAPVKDTRAQFVRVWVQDNGIGVPKQAQARLFTMFERLHPDYEGTGIGLAIVRKEVLRMGGEVGLESEEGQGSRFWFEVRRAEEAATVPSLV